MKGTFRTDECHVAPRRVVVAASLATVVMLLATTVWVFVYLRVGERASAVSLWTSHIEAVAESRKQAIRTWLAERRSDAEVLAWDPDLIGVCVEGTCPKGQDPDRLRAHLDNHLLYDRVLGAYLLTPDGELLLMAELGIPPGSAVGPMARKVARESRYLLHELHQTEDGTLLVGFLAPVFQRADPSQRSLDAPVLGVVGLYLDPRNTLFPLLQGEEFGLPTAETYLVGRDGGAARVLTPLQNLGSRSRVVRVTPEKTDSIELAALELGETSGAFIDYRGRRVLGSVRWISEAGWGLVVKVDEDVALAEWRREIFWEAALTAAGLLCIALGVVAAWRTWASRRYRLLLEGLRDREERLRALAHGSEDAVFIKDIDGRYLLVNPAASHMLGTNSEDALGRSARDFLSAEVATILESHERQVLETGRPFQGEEKIPVQGQDRIFLSSRIPIRDAQGNLQGVAGVLRDITDRKRSEEALETEAMNRRKAEQRLRRLHDSTAGLTGDLLFGQVMRALCQELGVRWVLVARVKPEGTAEPYAAVQDGKLFDWPPYPLADTPCEEVVAEKRLVHHSEDVQRRFPRSLFVQDHGVESYVGLPLFDSRGEMIGLLCAFHDKSFPLGEWERDLLDLYARRLGGEVERIRTEQSLTEARRALETLIQNLPGAVYRGAGRPDRSVEYISPGCEAVTGYSPAAFGGDAGVPLRDLIVPEDRVRAWREIEEAVASGKSYEIEYRIHDAHGNVRWVYDVGRAVEGEAGSPKTLEGVLFDHTERRSLEAQLTHSQRMEALGRLAGGVAHDFNNMLTAISGYAELLTMRLPRGERTSQAAEEILRAADRAADLTRQLLAFGRRQVVEPKVVDLNDTVRDVSRMLHRVLGEDIAFRLDLSPAAGSLRADPGQLEQVVMNLVVNARDAMPGGGRLVVRTSLDVLDDAEARTYEEAIPGEYAVIEVADTGVGIEPELLGHIFEPFFTTKEESKGTGLGLATVYGIVRQAGGHVGVASEPGKGTTLRVFWPRWAGGGQAAEVTEICEDGPGRGERLVLVEDEEAVLRVAVEHLEDRGYTVTPFASGREALGALSELDRVDALVTDVVMPGMGGPELAQRMRERWPGLPVVYVSGHAGEAAADLGARGPNTSFLQKPFRLVDLERSVRSAVGRGGLCI